jgi:CspA family cold shock protein
MLSFIFRLILAVVVGVIVSGLFAGYLSPEGSVYILDVRYVAAFLIATICTALLCSCIGGKSCTRSSSSSSRSQAKDSSAPRENGTVKWFNVSKGFGFITRENGEDIFVHYRNIRGEGRRRLFDGQEVEFSVIDSDKGLQADDIEVLKS